MSAESGEIEGTRRNPSHWRVRVARRAATKRSERASHPGGRSVGFDRPPAPWLVRTSAVSRTGCCGTRRRSDHLRVGPSHPGGVDDARRRGARSCAARDADATEGWSGRALEPCSRRCSPGRRSMDGNRLRDQLRCARKCSCHIGLGDQPPPDFRRRRDGDLLVDVAWACDRPRVGPCERIRPRNAGAASASSTAGPGSDSGRNRIGRPSRHPRGRPAGHRARRSGMARSAWRLRGRPPPRSGTRRPRLPRPESELRPSHGRVDGHRRPDPRTRAHAETPVAAAITVTHTQTGPHRHSVDGDLFQCGLSRLLLAESGISSGRSSKRPGGGVRVTVPAVTSTFGTIAATKGTSTSRSPVAMARRSCAGR